MKKKEGVGRMSYEKDYFEDTGEQLPRIQDIQRHCFLGSARAMIVQEYIRKLFCTSEGSK